MFLSIQQVTEIIKRSKFKNDFKERLFLILPKLEKYTLTGLGLEVDKKDSQLISGKLVKTWEEYAKIIKEFVNNNETGKSFLELLSEANETFNEERKIFFLYLAMDIKNLVVTNKVNIEAEIYNQILEYEITLFWNLPKEEVLFLLKFKILLLESKFQLVENIKVVIWFNSWHYEKDFSKIFTSCITQNFEVLGGIKISNWIEKYFNFSTSSTFRNDVIQVAEFLVKDPSVNILKDNERKTLSEILKLYIWLLKPEINEEEILAYKEFIRQQKMDELNVGIGDLDEDDIVYINSQQFQLPELAFESQVVPPVVPVPNKSVVEKQSKIKLNFDVDKTAVELNTKPVKIDEILKKKEALISPGLRFQSNEDQQATLKSIQRPKEMSKVEVPVIAPKSIDSFQPKAVEIAKQNDLDIDKKLQELEKRVKNKK